MRRHWRLFVVLALLSGLVPIGVVVADDAVVATCDDASFNTALATAQTNGGGTITFACSGTIVFAVEKTITTGNNVVIDGSGQNVIFDATTSLRLFAVQAGAGLVLNSVTLQNASVPASFGGAINNVGGVVQVDNSTFIDNTASHGGAIYNDTGGTVEVTASSFTGNAGINFGGAIYNGSGTIDITGSSFNANSANDDGGAINSLNGTLSIASSTFSSNISGASGGAIFIAGATATISNSTFDANESNTGAIVVGFGDLTVVNSTFSNNSAANRAGAIDIFESSVTITSSTFSGNDAASSSGAIHYDSGSLTIAGSIVAGNSAPSDTNCTIDGSFTSQGSNLSDDDSCEFTQPGDIQNSPAVDLGELADNGGPTRTMLPAATSDAVDNAACALAPAEDQRGISRPQGDACDIGAVEVRQGGTYTLCASYYTGAVTSPLSGGCSAGQFEVVVPGNVSFCINPWTGRVQYSFGRPCTPPRFAHTMPDDGDLLTCVSYYTGANRWVNNHSQCAAYEAPNTIPGTG